MQVLITRRQTLNAQTAGELNKRGHQPVSLPLALIVDAGADIPARDYEAILFTSQAPFEVLHDRPDDLERWIDSGCPVYCVGDETARQARLAGFESVCSACGNSEDLVRLIKSKHPKAVRPFLYLAGTVRQGGLERDLAHGGFEVELVEIYRSELLDPGRTALKSALQAASKGCGLLYSRRSATHLFQLCEKHDLQECLNLRGFVAISTNVAKAVEPLTTQPILVAKTPSQTALLDCVDQFQSG